MSQPTGKPLEGIKVVDLTYYVAGPGTAKIRPTGARTSLRSNPPEESPAG